MAASRERARQRADNIKPVIEQIQKAGITTLEGIARELNERNVKNLSGRRVESDGIMRMLKGSVTRRPGPASGSHPPAPVIGRRGRGRKRGPPHTRALRMARTVDEAKETRDDAVAMKAYAGRPGTRTWSPMIQMRTEIRVGELMEAQRRTEGLPLVLGFEPCPSPLAASPVDHPDGHPDGRQ